MRKGRLTRTTAGWIRLPEPDPVLPNCTTRHADARLCHRYGLTSPDERRRLQEAHAELILREEAFLLGPGNDNGGLATEVFEIGCYYPVWVPFEAVIVTYLTRGQAHWCTGWQFLL